MSTNWGFVCTAFDQTIRVLIVTKLKTLWPRLNWQVHWRSSLFSRLCHMQWLILLAPNFFAKSRAFPHVQNASCSLNWYIVFGPPTPFQKFLDPPLRSRCTTLWAGVQLSVQNADVTLFEQNSQIFFLFLCTESIIQLGLHTRPCWATLFKTPSQLEKGKMPPPHSPFTPSVSPSLSSNIFFRNVLASVSMSWLFVRWSPRWAKSKDLRLSSSNCLTVCVWAWQWCFDWQLLIRLTSVSDVWVYVR